MENICFRRKRVTFAIIESEVMTTAATIMHTTDPLTPPGCLLVQGALACGETATAIRRALVAQRAAGEAALRQRFERAQAAGDLPADADPAALARYMAAVVYGLAVQAAGGVGRAELQGVAETALRAWPTSGGSASGHESTSGHVCT